MRRPSYHIASGAALVTAAVLLIFSRMIEVALLPQTPRAFLMTEGGMIEMASALGYLLCIGLIAWLWPAGSLRRSWYFPVLLLAFSARELDADKIFFTEGLLKLSQYTAGTVGGGEMLVSILLVLGLVISTLAMLNRETGPFLADLRKFHPAAIAFLIGVAFIGAYKSIDGLGRKLAPFGIEVGETLNRYVTVVEEVGELGIPLMFGVAIILATRGTMAGRE